MSLIEKWFHEIEWGQAPDRILKEIEIDLREAIDECRTVITLEGQYMWRDGYATCLKRIERKHLDSGSIQKDGN